MKTKNLLIVLAIVFNCFIVRGQTTAMDFNIMDCNGNPHHLFADLDAGNAVIIEYFMINCSPCIVAGDALEVMKADLLAQFPGKIKTYAFGFNNTYTCTQVNDWVTNNNYTAVPSDSGATQVAYYGGMGMPTIVVLGGGTAHSVLGNPYVGFTANDTSTMANNIRNFLNPMGIEEASFSSHSVDIFPNPSNTHFNISFDLSKNSHVKIELIDVTGRIVAVLLNENRSKGRVNKTIETASFEKGNYILKISDDHSVLNKKITLTR